MYPSCHNNNYLHNTQKVIWTDYGILYSHYKVIQKPLELLGFWIKKVLKYGGWIEWNSKYRWRYSNWGPSVLPTTKQLVFVVTCLLGQRSLKYRGYG